MRNEEEMKRESKNKLGYWIFHVTRTLSAVKFMVVAGILGDMIPGEDSTRRLGRILSMFI